MSCGRVSADGLPAEYEEVDEKMECVEDKSKSLSVKTAWAFANA